MSGAQGNAWKSHKVTISSTENYKIRLTAVRGSSWSGDIAVDDLRLSNSSCDGKILHY